MNLIDKLNLRSKDYVAAVNVHPELAEAIGASSKGLVCVGKTKLRNFKYAREISSLDESAFDKVIVHVRHDSVPLNEIVRVTEHLGYVLLCDVQRFNLKDLDDLGIFEHWIFEDEKTCDLLFRVRKYSNVF